ncbi:MAG TPA: NifU family protein [Chitinophagales bacterium]|nr:NifU family protein [Chitinophagales bacterium]
MIAAQNDLLQRIELSLDSIRPYLEADGGNIKVVGVTENMTLQLKLLGNCEDCPMSFMTMKAGVEQAVKNAVPEILRVETV